MSVAAKSWREKKQSGGARQSKRVANADLAEQEALNVPKSKPKQQRRGLPKQVPLEVEICTDLEACKLRKMVDLLRTRDEISKATDQGKRRLLRVLVRRF